MNNRKLSFEDVQNSEIEIFENKFEINFNEDYIERLKAIDTKNIKEEEQWKELENILNLILNDDNAYNKIKTSYENHENKKFGIQILLKVLTFIFNEYSKEVNNIKGIDFGTKNLYVNREQRRNNNYKRNGNYNRYRR